MAEGALSIRVGWIRVAPTKVGRGTGAEARAAAQTTAASIKVAREDGRGTGVARRAGVPATAPAMVARIKAAPIEAVRPTAAMGAEIPQARVAAQVAAEEMDGKFGRGGGPIARGGGSGNGGGGANNGGGSGGSNNGGGNGGANNGGAGNGGGGRSDDGGASRDGGVARDGGGNSGGNGGGNGGAENGGGGAFEGGRGRGNGPPPGVETYEGLIQAAIQASRQNGYAQAGQFLNRAVAMDPNKPQAYDKLGELDMYYLNQVGSAIQNYQAAIGTAARPRSMWLTIIPPATSPPTARDRFTSRKMPFATRRSIPSMRLTSHAGRSGNSRKTVSP